LSDAELLGAILTNTNLTGVKLNYANINEVVMCGAVLKDAHMNSYKLVNSKIRNSDMIITNFYNADLTGKKFLKKF
jgi:uncharacterized protein YjbI with pentapeptide repeats